MKKYTTTIFSSLLMLSTTVFAEEKCIMEEGFEKFLVEPMRFKQTNEDNGRLDIFRVYQYKMEDGVQFFFKDTIDSDFKFDFYFQRDDIYQIVGQIYENKEYLFVGNIKIFNEESSQLVKTIEVKQPSPNTGNSYRADSETLKKYSTSKYSAGFKAMTQNFTTGVRLGIFPEGEYLIETNLCIHSKLKPFYRGIELTKPNNLGGKYVRD